LISIEQPSIDKGQSWFKRLKKNKVLLKEYSKNDSEIGRWLKHLFVTPAPKVWFSMAVEALESDVFPSSGR